MNPKNDRQYFDISIGWSICGAVYVSIFPISGHGYIRLRVPPPLALAPARLRAFGGRWAASDPLFCWFLADIDLLLLAVLLTVSYRPR